MLRIFTSEELQIDPVLCSLYSPTARMEEDIWHRHSGFYELVIVVDGTLWNESLENSSLQKTGDFFICAPESIHHYRKMRNTRYYNVFFKPELLEFVKDIPDMQRLLPEIGKISACFQLDDRHLTAVAQIADDICRELREKNVGWRENAVALLVRLLVCLLRSTAEDFFENTTSISYKINKALRFMETHFCEELSLELLADRVSMSESSFRHNFKNITGFSPRQYLIGLRLRQACQLLFLGKDIGEAARLAGFNDRAYFSRLFKKHMGMSPVLAADGLRTQKISLRTLEDSLILPHQ